MINRRKEKLKSRDFGLIGGLAVLNIILAVFW
jgi:hypothetical protein